MKFLKIRKIEESVNDDFVYDITVKDNNNFFANGVLVHNCHNYGTKKLLKFLKHPFKYKIGLSATVIRSDNAHWNIKEVFDYNVFSYSPKQGLIEGVLNPFDFVDVSIVMDDESYENYTKLTQDINLIIQSAGGYFKVNQKPSLRLALLKKLNERKQLIANYYGKFDVIKWICRNNKDKKILIFNEYNSQTNRAYWHLLEEGVNARIIHSGIDKQKRDDDLIAYKRDKFNVVLTSKVLDEGYNLPSIDVGVIMAGNSTARQTIQRLGRILRRKNTNSLLYQIYCKNTVEEKYSNKRSLLFQEICSDYKFYLFEDGKFI